MARVMPKLAANLTMLFTEVPFLERFARARQAGFTRVEYLLPYAYSPKELKAVLDDNGLEQVLFNLPAGNWAGGERGIAALPGREGEFRAGVAQAIEYARALAVSRLNCLAGKRLHQFSDEEHRKVLVENVRFAAQAMKKEGLTLLVEAINHFDVPGFFLNRTSQALQIIAEAAAPNVRLLYDIYHAQREEGELAATLRRHSAQIGHIQIADNPGRHQPGTGEIHFPFVFREIDAVKYDGCLGLEYIPAPDTAASLGWITEMNCEL
jgi:hydroxypyruvate isomerase